MKFRSEKRRSAESMQGLMMQMPLLVSSLLEHADRHHGDTQVVSRRVEGEGAVDADVVRNVAELIRAEMDSLRADLQNVFTPAAGHRLSVGLSYDDTPTEYSSDSAFGRAELDQSVTARAVFGQYDWSPAMRCQFVT